MMLPIRLAGADSTLWIHGNSLNSRPDITVSHSEKYHTILEYSAKHYGVPVLDRIPDLVEFE